MHRVRRKLTYANVVATIALFVALGGTGAYATHELIYSTDIVDGQVRTADLGGGSVTAPKLAFNTINAGKVIDNSLRTEDVQDGTVGAADLGPDSVGPDEIANGSLSSAEYAFAKGTLAVDFTSIAAKSCVSSSIAVPGALLGDIMLVSNPGNVSGYGTGGPLVVDGMVTAAGNMAIRVCNISDSAFDPGPASFTWMILH